MEYYFWNYNYLLCATDLKMDIELKRRQVIKIQKF